MKFHQKASYTTLGFFVHFLFPVICYGQQSIRDSVLFTQTQDSIITFYKNEVKSNLRLYNGSEYVSTAHGARGFPYFESDGMLTGSAFYDGNMYDNVLMRYDLVNDEIMILDYTKSFPIKLVSDKVKYFTIGGNRFINAALYPDLHLPEASGFYEVLYHKNTLVIARKEKKLKLSEKTEEDIWYKQFNQYFIYQDNKFYSITNKRTLLNALTKKKTELKKFISDHDINFKRNFEEALIKTANYFDQIEK